MSSLAPLHALLDASASQAPGSIAVEETSGTAVTYSQLAALSDRVRDRLVHLGVRPGDRVGLCMGKSIDGVAAAFGVLKAGAAYVPVDAEAPTARSAYILADCQVAVVIADAAHLPLRDAMLALGCAPLFLFLTHDAKPISLTVRLDLEQQDDAAPAADTVASAPDDLAYILYTSGSTGRPKGVMLTHRAARCFIDWCSETFQPRPDDTYSSHAPFHFDLSIHDIFVPLKHQARLVLIGEQLGKEPVGLAAVIAEKKISVWYSTPSVLNLMARHGRLERHDFSRLRLVLFAGEVFPIPQLRSIMSCWPDPRYFNLYGPTETNVCTAFEVPRPIPADQTAPCPIGRMCPPLSGRVIDADGDDVTRGEVGELVVSGPGVMSGYWNLPEHNERAFLVDARGAHWYRTGDLVVEGGGGNYVFHGRRDRMVKRRGYRVELGEIEAGLALHPDIQEVAVVASSDPEAGVRLTAYLGVGGGARLSPIALKQFSTTHLPRYMVPDAFVCVDVLPRTSTDKIDYQALTSAD
jgi:amino acid adenylation domain-containing protein